MDVIASGLEACPWGLNGYGFDSYAASAPGNGVLALARFWLDNVRTIMSAEQAFADRCLRLRYEDLVAEPKLVTGQVFDFLGVQAAPEVVDRCFSAEREQSGPADYKIWSTRSVSSESVGRGWAIPATMIDQRTLELVNNTIKDLDYLPIGEDWGTSAPPSDLRIDSVSNGRPFGAEGSEPARKSALELIARLNSGLMQLGDDIAQRWGARGSEKIVAVVVSQEGPRHAEYVLVDLTQKTASFCERSVQDTSHWDVVASADAWQQILAGKLNISVAFRSCKLRYCDNGDTDPALARTRMQVMTDILLGISG
jgi:hypothetical protein